jgi:hypothetical protein
METTPTNNVQGKLKLKWACLIKLMADADIPIARIQMQGSMPNQILIPICLYWKIGNNIEKAIQRCKPKSEVVELVAYNASKQPRTRCNAKYQPNPQAASFFVWGGIPNLNLAHLHTTHPPQKKKKTRQAQTNSNKPA